MPNILKFPYHVDTYGLIDFTFIAGPLKMVVSAENKFKAIEKADLRLGSKIPSLVWVQQGDHLYCLTSGE